MDRDVADVTQRLPSIPAFILRQLVIDCQKLVDTGLLPKIDDLIYDIETASKVLCHAIHTRRLNFCETCS
jgi:hypothetical protein